MAPYNPNHRQNPVTPNRDPTTARGQRRSAKTPEYRTNKEARGKQSYGHRIRGTGGYKSGPFKGPSSRPKGTGSDAWKKYMSGSSSAL